MALLLSRAVTGLVKKGVTRVTYYKGIEKMNANAFSQKRQITKKTAKIGDSVTVIPGFPGKCYEWGF